MENEGIIPDFRLTNGGDLERPFPEYLGDFNILAIRRVPMPSHGPATKVLQRLLAQNRGAEGGTVRGFDIRSPDRPCGTCRGPHIVFAGPDLATICDSDGRILRKFGVVGYDRFFVVRSGLQVVDVGSISEIGLSGIERVLAVVRAQNCPGVAETEKCGLLPNGFRRKVSSVPCI